jgi:hypothetical protein
LDTLVYPDPAVRGFITDHLVPVKLVLNRPADQPHFRAHRIIWTPTVAILDRRGVGHYTAPGYLPAPLFLHMLHIGLARALLAWAGHERAAALLQPVADDAKSALAPEALYWLGVTWYLQTRRRAPMMVAWNRLRAEHPTSLWAARVPPNQDDGPEP